MTEPVADEPALIADGWKRMRPGAFINLVGPFYFREVEGRMQFCYRVAPKHDNTTGRPHGGMTMTFLDEAFGWTAHQGRSGQTFFTVGFDCQFIGGSVAGDLVVTETEVVSSTRSMVFVRGTAKVGDRVIASATGIWKAVRAR
ncbi:MAG: PaaI family thioesterase [Mesorhizobium sp.]